MPIEHATEELSRRLRESEQTNELLREQNRKLDTALNNMSQGLCMYDADARHVLCNRRYLEIMDLSAEFAAPGRRRSRSTCRARSRRRPRRWRRRPRS